MQAIKEIIKNMTLEQKAAQLVQIPYAQIGREKSEEWARRGVGSFLHVFGEDAKHLQKIAIESGAKIPLLFGIDAVHGHCLNRKATIFPTQLSMACAFDPELIKRVAQAAAKEISADGLHQTFSPVLASGGIFVGAEWTKPSVKIRIWRGS